MNAILTERNDVTSVAVTDAEGRRLTLALTPRAETCNTTEDKATADAALAAFAALLARPGTAREKMARLKAHAEAAPDLASYIAGIAAL